MTALALHYEDLPRVSDVLGDLESTPLGMKVLELLALAQEVHQKSELEWERAVLNGRRSSFHAAPVASLAAAILNRFGPPEDCFVMRELAEAEASR